MIERMESNGTIILDLGLSWKVKIKVSRILKAWVTT